MATINGTSKKNKLTGLAFNDLIRGFGDNDTLDGGAGNDTLQGGDGNDSMNGGFGNDKLFGDSGNDTLRGGDSNDNLSGGIGNDKLFGGNGNDTLTGSSGADRIEGGSGIDVLTYATENNAVSIFLDNSQISSGNAFGDTFSGIENVIGSRFGDVISGNSVANTLIGGTGEDVLFGRGGLDQLLGGDGDDVLLPGADTAADVINGGDGNDTVSYQDATQRVGISLENNLSDFGANNDIYISIENVIGTELDNDAIQVAFGGAAFGLGGTDVLEGSRATGLDKQSTEFLTGGLGIDGFILHLGTGADALLDFDGLSGGDNIFVFAAEFTGINTGASFVLTTEGFVTASIASAQFIYERLTDTLYFDADGIAGGSGPVLIAYLPDLGASAVLTNDHFVII